MLRSTVPGALAVALTVALTVGLAGVAAPTQATLTIPVDCSDGRVELRWDDTSYDLDGPCGVVRVTADDATVSMPTATRLVVTGDGNTVDAKPVTQLRVRGRGNDLRPVSVKNLRLASPGSEVSADGLVETARLRRTGGTLTADQVSTLVVRGTRHVVKTRRGFDARVLGDQHRVGYRWLDSLVVTGKDNAVRVRRGRTEVHDSGSHNRIRVARRG